MAGCAQKTVKEKETIYSVTSPLQTDTSFIKDYVAQVKSIRNVEIRAQEKGYLQNIYVDEGQHVNAGQVMFRIMPKLFEADVAKAQAETKQAEIEMQNTKMLVDKNIVSKNEQAMAQAKLSAANAETTSARLHLSLTQIRAPFAGSIDRIPKKLGSLIAEGDLLTTLSDNTQMYAYFNLSEPEYLAYETNIGGRASTKVSLILANGEPFLYQGDVGVVESEFNGETGNIAFRAKFLNPDKLLKNGETGKIEMKVPLKNALLIPQKSTFTIQDKMFVFVVDKNNKVQSRNITTAGELNDLYVVATGLSAGDRFLLDGVQKVKDDDKIKYNFLAPKVAVANLKLKAE